MSDILAVFSIVAVSLAAITIVIRLLPLLMLAALVLLAVWVHSCETVHKDLSCISSTFSASVGRILLLFILQASVSAICSSEVAKKGKKSREEDVHFSRRYEQLNSSSRITEALIWTQRALGSSLTHKGWAFYLLMEQHTK